MGGRQGCREAMACEKRVAGSVGTRSEFWDVCASDFKTQPPALFTSDPTATQGHGYGSGRGVNP